MEIDVGRMNAEQMGHAARFAARLAEHWGDEHKATGALFGRLADELTRCQVELMQGIATIELRQVDTITGRMALGMVGEDEPIELGWIDKPGADLHQVSKPDDVATGDEQE